MSVKPRDPQVADNDRLSMGGRQAGNGLRFSFLVCRCESQLNEKRKTRNVVYFRVLAINSAAECGAISLAVNSPRNSPSDFPLQ